MGMKLAALQTEGVGLVCCHGNDMTDGYVLKALRSRTKSLSLDNSQLQVLSPTIGRLEFLVCLSAKNNQLQTLPAETALLKRLTYLNLGGNQLATIPDCLVALTNLQTLHLFKNKITSLPSNLPSLLGCLTLLNLNDNLLTSLPPSLHLLTHLKQLSVSNNALTHLPPSLPSLTELYLDGNKLKSLPSEIGCLHRLQKLLVHKNQLDSIPSSISGCRSLTTLDVSCNQIELFPSELGDLKLKEFYYEANPLIPHIPVPAEQQAEVLPLRELAARLVVREIREGDVRMSAAVGCCPDVQLCISKAGTCAVCRGPFVNSWLECAQFTPARKLLPLQNQAGVIPLRALLCSYQCFNSEGHQLFGVAAPPG